MPPTNPADAPVLRVRAGAPESPAAFVLGEEADPAWVLRDGWWERDLPAQGTLIVRTTPGDDEGPGWMAPARGAMLARLEALEARAPGRALVVLPHAGGVLSDAPSTLGFLRARSAGGRWGVLLDVVGMLTPEMRGDGEDHVGRLVAWVCAAPGAGGAERLWGVVLPSEPAWRGIVERGIEERGATGVGGAGVRRVEAFAFPEGSVGG